MENEKTTKRSEYLAEYSDYFPDEFRQQIILGRNRKNLSQVAVSTAIGISQTRLSRLEKGTIKTISSDEALALWDLLDIPEPEELDSKLPFKVWSIVKTLKNHHMDMSRRDIDFIWNALELVIERSPPGDLIRPEQDIDEWVSKNPQSLSDQWWWQMRTMTAYLHNNLLSEMHWEVTNIVRTLELQWGDEVLSFPETYMHNHDGESRISKAIEQIHGTGFKLSGGYIDMEPVYKRAMEIELSIGKVRHRLTVVIKRGSRDREDYVRRADVRVTLYGPEPFTTKEYFMLEGALQDFFTQVDRRNQSLKFADD